MPRPGRGVPLRPRIPLRPPAWGKRNPSPPNFRHPPPGSETRPREGGRAPGTALVPLPAAPRLPGPGSRCLAACSQGAGGEKGGLGPPRGKGPGHGPHRTPERSGGRKREGRGEGKPFFSSPFSPRLSRSDPQYLEKVFEDVWEGGREFSAEKLNLPYSSGCIWDLSPLTAPQGTDMIFRTTLQLPKIPSSLPGCLPGCIALLRQKGESNLNPQQTNTPRGRQERALSPSPPSPQCESHGRRGSRERGDVMLGWRKGHKCKR